MPRLRPDFASPDFVSRQTGGTLLGFILGLILGLGHRGRGGAVHHQCAGAIRQQGATGQRKHQSGRGRTVARPEQAAAVGTATGRPGHRAAAPGSTPRPIRRPLRRRRKRACAALADDGSRYLLQAGAFKTPEDADAMRARLALMGFDAKIFPREQDGQTLYRVRLGPYGNVEDVNRMRKTMAENGVDVQLIKVR